MRELQVLKVVHVQVYALAWCPGKGDTGSLSHGPLTLSRVQFRDISNPKENAMNCRKFLWALSLFAGMLLLAPVAAWAQGDYLDSTIVKVKPDKVADFESIAKKIADANRKANGDHWLAEVSVYGEGNVYVFTSRRESYADIDKGNDMFMAAVNKALGKEASMKVLNDFNNCIVSSRSELRRRRPDLSSKWPADPQALNKMVGEARVLRDAEIRIRYGHVPDFENYMKDVVLHISGNPDTQPVLVSQVVEGGRGGATFHLTFFRTGLGGFDNNPSLKSMVDEDTYAKFQKTIGEIEAGSESTIYRFVPELSNPPQEIAEVAADYWNPKPVMAMAKSKPKAAEATPSAKPSEKPKN
jgi:hypothetical protein